MKIIATMPVRNEDWCLALTARAALMWCDELVILDHYSCDTTDEIVRKVMQESGRVIPLYAGYSPWDEMDHRQTLLAVARKREATHIAIIDADELLTGNLLPKMRELVAATPRGSMLELPQVNIRGELGKMEAGAPWGRNYCGVAFEDRPGLTWKPADDGYQHHHRAPFGQWLRPLRPVKLWCGGVFHLQMLNERRLAAKQFAYQLTDRLRWPNRRTATQVRAYYSPTFYGSGAVHDVPADWWEPYKDLLHYLKPDAEPWQLAECRRIIRENPGIEAGLDPFGIEL